MTERLEVGDLVLLNGEALKARFPGGLDVDSTTPLRVVTIDKTTGMVVVGLQIFELPFHESLIMRAPPVAGPHGEPPPPPPEPEPPPPETQVGGLGAGVGPRRDPVQPPPMRPPNPNVPMPTQPPPTGPPPGFRPR